MKDSGTTICFDLLILVLPVTFEKLISQGVSWLEVEEKMYNNSRNKCDR